MKTRSAGIAVVATLGVVGAALLITPIVTAGLHSPIAPSSDTTAGPTPAAGAGVAETWEPLPIPQSGSKLSFARGAELSGVDTSFRNGLERVYDWTSTGVTENDGLITWSFRNEVAGCDVTDATTPYLGAHIDDEVATAEVITSVVADGELVQHPQLGIWGLNEPMGEDGAHYEVLEAVVAHEGGFTLYSGRAFPGAGVQNIRTVTCGGVEGIVRTIGQLRTVAYAVAHF